MAEVCRPPWLRPGHKFAKIPFHTLKVETLELIGVVKSLLHWIRFGAILAKDIEIQLVRPPIPIGRATTGPVRVRSARDRTLSFFFFHVSTPYVLSIERIIVHATGEVLGAVNVRTHSSLAQTIALFSFPG